MGSGFHGGFGYTFGTIENETANLLPELKKSGVKYTEGDIVFITRDQNGKIVWLENGNETAGLSHILSRHEKDFLNKFNISKSQISNYLFNVFSTGVIIYTKKRYINGHIGYTNIILYNGSYFIQTGVGGNGFIISAFPIDEFDAMKYIGGNK